MATRIGDAAVLLSVLPGRHAALLHVSDLEEREQISAQWLRLADQAKDRESAALALAWRSYDLFESGEIELARPLSARLNLLAEELRQPLYASFAATWNFVFSELEGDLGAAERHARDGHRLAELAGGTFANSLYGGQLFGLHRDRGQLAALRPLVEPIVQPRLAIWRAGYLAITLAEGDSARAREELAAIATDHFAAVRRDGFWLAATCMLAETAITLDARDAMAELAAQLEPYGDRCAQIGLALFLGPVSGFEGRLRRALGEHERADALLEDARARCDAAGAQDGRAAHAPGAGPAGRLTGYLAFDVLKEVKALVAAAAVLAVLACPAPRAPISAAMGPATSWRSHPDGRLLHVPRQRRGRLGAERAGHDRQRLGRVHRVPGARRLQRRRQARHARPRRRRRAADVPRQRRRRLRRRAARPSAAAGARSRRCSRPATSAATASPTSSPATRPARSSCTAATATAAG